MHDSGERTMATSSETALEIFERKIVYWVWNLESQKSPRVYGVPVRSLYRVPHNTGINGHPQLQWIPDAKMDLDSPALKVLNMVHTGDSSERWKLRCVGSKKKTLRKVARAFVDLTEMKTKIYGCWIISETLNWLKNGGTSLVCLVANEISQSANPWICRFKDSKRIDEGSMKIFHSVLT